VDDSIDRVEWGQGCFDCEWQRIRDAHSALSMTVNKTGAGIFRRPICVWIEGDAVTAEAA
jgi:hypothetical protein